MKSFNFEGNGLEYFKIWIVNILLTIVTIGLYYPWAKVRNKRYIYANSTLESRNFDYHATGKQLFIGYLIAMALLITYLVLQNMSPTGSIILGLVFFAALPWIIWRSLKFNMRITSFSNVRFAFDGKLGAAYINYLLLPILFFVSLYAAPVMIGLVLANKGSTPGASTISVIVGIVGLAAAVFMYGFIKKRNTSYVINSTSYGQGRFSTDLQTSKFVKILLKTIGLFFIAIIAYTVVMAIILTLTGSAQSLIDIQSSLGDPEAAAEVFENVAVLGVVAALYIGFILVSIVVASYSFTRQRAYIFANTKLDGKIALASTMSARRLAWISVSNFLAIIFTLSLAVPWATVRITRFTLEHSEIDTSVDLEAYVSQQQAEQSSLGEQIGDAFDVDIGIGI